MTEAEAARWADIIWEQYGRDVHELGDRVAADLVCEQVTPWLAIYRHAGEARQRAEFTAR